MRRDARPARGGLARALFLALVASVLVAGPGCLRRKFDLCLEDPPHPDCPRDAGADASADAAVVPDAPSDRSSDDAATGGPDAFVAADAP